MSAIKSLVSLLQKMRERGMNLESAATSHKEEKDGKVVSGESATYRASGDRSRLPGNKTADATVAGMLDYFEGRGLKVSGVSSSRTVSERRPDGTRKTVAHEEASWSSGNKEGGK